MSVKSVESNKTMAESETVRKPTAGDIRQLSADLGFGISEDELESYKELICETMTKHYDVMSQYDDVSLGVKYPREGWTFPAAEENPYNAWYCKSDIPGAPAGILTGFTVVIKDCIPVAGLPMKNGSNFYKDYIPDYDASVVTRILDAGGTIVGKATCEDMCCSGTSYVSKPHPVTNPNNPGHVAGGSSSGCAVLVKTGEVAMAMGADQAGSIRSPASWTGIVGHKPTYGLIPYTGIDSLVLPLDHAGPMAGSVRECALLLQATAGYDDGRDMRQDRIPETRDLPKYSQLLSGDVSGMKVGLVQEGFEGCEDDVAMLTREVALSLCDQGATIEDVSIPIHNDAGHFIQPTRIEGTYSSMIRDQGYPVGPPSFYATSSIDNNFNNTKTRSKELSKVVKSLSMSAKFVSDNYGQHFYAKSQNLLKVARNRYDEALARYDVLVMPTMKFKAPKMPDLATISTADYVRQALNMFANTTQFDGTGHPATTIPIGYSGGLPVGMMIVARHLEDDKALNVAYAYEQKLKK